MANEQQVSQHGVIDTDGFPFSGLLIPSATGGIAPGGVPLGPDANSDDYAGALSVLVTPNPVGQNVAITNATQTSYVAKLLAQGANKLNYLVGWHVSLGGQIGATATHTVTITGLAGLSFTFNFTYLTTESPKPIVFTFPQPMPASTANGEIDVTITKNGGGNISFTGTITAWGFWRPV